MRTLSGGVVSRWPSGSVVTSDCPACQYSVPLLRCTIFGQVLLAVQRARMPSLLAVNGSVSFSYANGNSLPGKYMKPWPAGLIRPTCEKRKFRNVRPDATVG